MGRISYEVLKNHITAGNAVSAFSWNDVNIEVKRYLGMEDMIAFTSAVYDSCFSSKTGEYRPEVKDLVIRSCILEIYANFDLPDDPSERYSLIYQSNIVPEIMQHVDQNQFNTIMIAIDSKIDARLNANVVKFEKDMEETRKVLNKLFELIEDTFKGVDNETVNQIAEAISNMRIDPEEFAKLVVEANTKVLRDAEEAQKENAPNKASE